MCSVASEAAAEDRPGEMLCGRHGLVCNFIRLKTERNSGASFRCSDVLTLLNSLWPPTMLEEPTAFSRTGRVISNDSRSAEGPACCTRSSPLTQGCEGPCAISMTQRMLSDLPSSFPFLLWPRFCSFWAITDSQKM